MQEVPLRDKQAPSASGESTGNAIWISDNNSSDTEDKDNVKDHNLNRSQSGCITPITASIVDHLNSMCTKHSETKTDAAVHIGVTAVLPPARLEGVQILSHESQIDLSSDPESNQQVLPSMTYTPTGDITAYADTDSNISLIRPETQASLGALDRELMTKPTGATSELDVITIALSNKDKVRLSAERNNATPAARSSSPRLRLLPELRPEQD
ncbi:Uncharacterized protein HZ326_21301 [Fusarium oxysporum f. sp. albedinis]|nr:Uncharacterized protein HZ326_21301 [Fusarium oxysporum f. sp. albedinis]